MKELAIFYDDGRPSCRIALDAMVTSDPFAWDGMVREGRIDPAEGYPPPQTVRLASRQILRTDVGEMLRLDVTWVDGALTANTERLPSHVPGAAVHVAHEQAGRTLVLANREEAGHVAQVEIDREVALQRRFGFMCDVGRLGAALSRYWTEATARFPGMLSCGRGAQGVAEVCALHELIRRAHPEWYEPELSELYGRPVWDESKICGEHGYPEAAWWRTAARAAADGEFYSPAGTEVAQAFVWRPAVAWWRENPADFVETEEEFEGESSKEDMLTDAANWLGLPDLDFSGTGALALVKDAWNDRVQIVDLDQKLASALSAYGVDLAAHAKKRERGEEEKRAGIVEIGTSKSDAHARARGRLRGRPEV